LNLNESTVKNKAHEGMHWQDKVSNHHQLGGIETSILDNGAGKGVRIAWINTGSGLRFKVVLDRAMDIAEAFYNKHSLAWISHLGVTPSDLSVISGTNWLNGFGGGLLTTCGLTHTGGPEKDEYGERGVHDRISHIRAMVESIVQPDLNKGNLRMSITGRMLQYSMFGPQLELKRTISAILGTSKITIEDEVTNLGNEPAPHMLLYHFNFGWPLIDEGTEISAPGVWKSRGRDSDNILFNSNNDYKKCKAPIDAHNKGGESVAFINIEPEPSGICECSISNHNIPLKVKLQFKKEQLPWLTNWQHWGRNEYVIGLEPGTHPPIGQSAARQNHTLLFIKPGETRFYETVLEVFAE
jgi:hypothetical protein